MFRRLRHRPEIVARFRSSGGVPVQCAVERDIPQVPVHGDGIGEHELFESRGLLRLQQTLTPALCQRVEFRMLLGTITHNGAGSPACLHCSQLSVDALQQRPANSPQRLVHRIRGSAQHRGQPPSVKAGGVSLLHELAVLGSEFL